MVRWYRARAALAAPAWGMAMGDGHMAMGNLGPLFVVGPLALPIIQIHPDDQVQSQ